jgi:hypothetical protein
MSHEKEGKEKTGKKSALLSLKEKRAAKAAKRDEKGGNGKITVANPFEKKK